MKIKNIVVLGIVISSILSGCGLFDGDSSEYQTRSDDNNTYTLNKPSTTAEAGSPTNKLVNSSSNTNKTIEDISSSSPTSDLETCHWHIGNSVQLMNEFVSVYLNH